VFSIGNEYSKPEYYSNTIILNLNSVNFINLEVKYKEKFALKLRYNQ